MKLLLLFEIFIALSNAQVQITCEYEFKDFSIPDGPIYACKILNDIQDLSYENRDVIEVHGVHLPNKNDKDIKGIWTENNYHLTYFPRKLTKRFPNLKVIHYNKSRLMEVSKEDLEEFGEQLINFVIKNSNLSSIEKDLFIKNENIQNIDISFNQIYYIDCNVFENLNNLKSLTVGGNICLVNQGYFSNDVTHVINQVKNQCTIRL